MYQSTVYSRTTRLAPAETPIKNLGAFGYLTQVEVTGDDLWVLLGLQSLRYGHSHKGMDIGVKQGNAERTFIVKVTQQGASGQTWP